LNRAPNQRVESETADETPRGRFAWELRKMNDRRTGRRRSRLVALTLAFLLPALAPLTLCHASVRPLDLGPFRAATCAELQGEYKATLEVNREVLEEMRRSNRDTAGTNLLGAATFATMGFGMFTSGDNAEAESAQEELEAYQRALVVVAAEKKCTLPGSGPGPEAKAQ
jgi:hypothetical protein